MEDPELYIQSVETYRQITKERDKFGDYLDRVEVTVKTLKPKIYNPTLLSFDEKYQQYLNNELPLTDYFDTLLLRAKALEIPLSPYPHLQGLRSLKNLESKIDFKVASQEEQKAVGLLSLEDQKEISDALNEDHSPFKVGAKDDSVKIAFFAVLEEKLTQNRHSVRGEGSNSLDSSPPFGLLRMTNEFPELFKYFRYLKVAKKLNPKEILKEQKFLEKIIFQALTQTSDEEKLLSAAKNLGGLKKLFNLTLTPEEFEEYRREHQTFDIKTITGFLNKKIMDLKNYYERAIFLENGYEDTISKCEEFYRLTYQRDQKFIDNLTQKMDEESQQKAVLITGGYHSPNLKQLLKEKNISYVVLTPQILQETNLPRYEKILLSQDLTKAKALLTQHRTTLQGIAGFTMTGLLQGQVPLAPAGALNIIPEIENLPAAPAAHDSHVNVSSGARLAQDQRNEDLSYYKILEVPKSATGLEIKKAYRRLAVKHHPDKNPDNIKDAEEKFKQLNEAYEVLGNPMRRARYDQYEATGQDYSGGVYKTGNKDFDDFFDPNNPLYAEYDEFMRDPEAYMWKKFRERYDEFHQNIHLNRDDQHPLNASAFDFMLDFEPTWVKCLRPFPKSSDLSLLLGSNAKFHLKEGITHVLAGIYFDRRSPSQKVFSHKAEVSVRETKEAFHVDMLIPGEWDEKAVRKSVKEHNGDNLIMTWERRGYFGWAKKSHVEGAETVPAKKSGQNGVAHVQRRPESHPPSGILPHTVVTITFPKSELKKQADLERRILSRMNRLGEYLDGITSKLDPTEPKQKTFIELMKVMRNCLVYREMSIIEEYGSPILYALRVFLKDRPEVAKYIIETFMPLSREYFMDRTGFVDYDHFIEHPPGLPDDYYSKQSHEWAIPLMRVAVDMIGQHDLVEYSPWLFELLGFADYSSRVAERHKKQDFEVNDGLRGKLRQTVIENLSKMSGKNEIIRKRVLGLVSSKTTTYWWIKSSAIEILGDAGVAEPQIIDALWSAYTFDEEYQKSVLYWDESELNGHKDNKVAISPKALLALVKLGDEKAASIALETLRKYSTNNSNDRHSMHQPEDLRTAIQAIRYIKDEKLLSEVFELLKILKINYWRVQEDIMWGLYRANPENREYLEWLDKKSFERDEKGRIKSVKNTEGLKILIETGKQEYISAGIGLWERSSGIGSQRREPVPDVNGPAILKGLEIDPDNPTYLADFEQEWISGHKTWSSGKEARMVAGKGLALLSDKKVGLITSLVTMEHILGEGYEYKGNQGATARYGMMYVGQKFFEVYRELIQSVPFNERLFSGRAVKDVRSLFLQDTGKADSSGAIVSSDNGARLAILTIDESISLLNGLSQTIRNKYEQQLNEVRIDSKTKEFWFAFGTPGAFLGLVLQYTYLHTFKSPPSANPLLSLNLWSFLWMATGAVFAHMTHFVRTDMVIMKNYNEKEQHLQWFLASLQELKKLTPGTPGAIQNAEKILRQISHSKFVVGLGDDAIYRQFNQIQDAVAQYKKKPSNTPDTVSGMETSVKPEESSVPHTKQGEIVPIDASTVIQVDGCLMCYGVVGVQFENGIPKQGFPLHLFADSQFLQVPERRDEDLVLIQKQSDNLSGSIIKLAAPSEKIIVISYRVDAAEHVRAVAHEVQSRFSENAPKFLLVQRDNNPNEATLLKVTQEHVTINARETLNLNWKDIRSLFDGNGNRPTIDLTMSALSKKFAGARLSGKTSLEDLRSASAILDPILRDPIQYKTYTWKQFFKDLSEGLRPPIWMHGKSGEEYREVQKDLIWWITGTRVQDAEIASYLPRLIAKSEFERTSLQFFMAELESDPEVPTLLKKLSWLASYNDASAEEIAKIMERHHPGVDKEFILRTFQILITYNSVADRSTDIDGSLNSLQSALENYRQKVEEQESRRGLGRSAEHSVAIKLLRNRLVGEIVPSEHITPDDELKDYLLASFNVDSGILTLKRNPNFGKNPNYNRFTWIVWHYNDNLKSKGSRLAAAGATVDIPSIIPTGVFFSNVVRFASLPEGPRQIALEDTVFKITERNGLYVATAPNMSEIVFNPRVPQEEIQRAFILYESTQNNAPSLAPSEAIAKKVVVREIPISLLDNLLEKNVLPQEKATIMEKYIELLAKGFSESQGKTYFRFIGDPEAVNQAETIALKNEATRNLLLTRDSNIPEGAIVNRWYNTETPPSFPEPGIFYTPVYFTPGGVPHFGLMGNLSALTVRSVTLNPLTGEINALIISDTALSFWRTLTGNPTLTSEDITRGLKGLAGKEAALKSLTTVDWERLYQTLRTLTQVSQSA